MLFDSLDDIRTFCRDLPAGDRRFAEAATRRQQNLTKPPGSLGRLEELAIWLAQWQGREQPRLDRVTVAVFAGNHGVAARGVSAYPAAVTAQMVANFIAGGAAINQIARLAGAELHVVPIELEQPTSDFTEAAAMDADEYLTAVEEGCRAVPDDCDLLAVGEMGIANTTAAAALCSALLGGGGDRGGAEFSSRHSRRSARGGSRTRWPRTCGDSGRRARREATPHPGAARRVRGDICGAAAGAP
jgi:nicotinate-nucleotide--dimethylbenzimidazole phosphoribosyltransferase